MSQHEPHLIPHGKKRKVRDVMHQLSAKHVHAMQTNKHIAKCCAQVENHDVELFKSHADHKEPDVMVLTCSCGRRHIRMAAGPGTTGTI